MDAKLDMDLPPLLLEVLEYDDLSDLLLRWLLRLEPLLLCPRMASKFNAGSGCAAPLRERRNNECPLEEEKLVEGRERERERVLEGRCRLGGE